MALLYEQAIEDLKRARAAIDRGDIEARTRAINHAVVVIGYLQSSLDKEQGGRVAANLERFYNQLRASLVEAQFAQSAAIVERQISYLVEVHAAWCEVERANAAPAIARDRTPSLPAQVSGPSSPGQPGQSVAGQSVSGQSVSGQSGELEYHAPTEWNA